MLLTKRYNSITHNRKSCSHHGAGYSGVGGGYQAPQNEQLKTAQECHQSDVGGDRHANRINQPRYRGTVDRLRHAVQE
ncbi:hypothetical protein MB901379_04078 [Mycobacterium basiliense]|uniref:Uncharacterized protein n=1 Tax=Mycobacterium basiliense TaxID=2094119 RepID=A0A447GJ01_9MYCO|nr:hypothetical protein MB901379_04078 [Mycobacterium basiliense]